MSPVLYILISLLFTSLMLGIIFLVAYFKIARKPHALAWSITFFIGSIQWFCNIFSESIFSTRDYYWFTVNAISITLISIGLWGYRSRAQLDTHLGLLISFAVIFEGMIIWFTLADYHYGLRVSLGVFYSSAALFLMGCAAIKDRQNPMPAEIGATAVIIIFSISQMLAGIVALLQGAQPDQYYLDLYLAINFLAQPSAYIGVGLFSVFIMASDLSEEMRNLAMTDQLTGILNRRGFFEAANRALSYARRTKKEISLVLCDLDNFKDINDKHGHATGDETLSTFAGRLKLDLRDQDILGRIGGEEFAILLPDANLATGNDIAERIRSVLADSSFKTGGIDVSFTASFGVTGIDTELDSISIALEKADKALYKAKESGRNQVVCFV